MKIEEIFYKLNKYLILLFFVIVPLSPWKVKYHGIPVSADFVLASLIILVFFIRILMEKRLGFVTKEAFVMNKFSRFVIIYVAVALLSFVKSINIPASINEFLRFLSYILLYYIIIFTVKDVKDIQDIMKSFIFSCFLVTVFGIMQYFTGIGMQTDYYLNYGSIIFRRVPSTMFNPNNFAAYLMIASYPILLSFMYIREKRIKKFLIILFALVLINLGLTFTRGAWLGFVLSAVVMAIVYNKKIAYLLAALLIPAFSVSGIRNRFLSIFTLTSDSNITRLKLWKTGLAMFKDNPLLGVGLGNSIYWYDEYIRRYPQLKTVFSYTMYPLHNSYIKTMAEMGILGLAAFLMLLGYMSVKSYKIFKYNDEPLLKGMSLGYFISMFGYLFMNFVDNSLFDPQTAVFFWLGFALIVSFEKVLKNAKA